MHRIINAVWLEITTGCNRRCPECCCGIGTRPVVHHPWEYFEAAVPYLRGIRHVNLTGGEPMFHPQFDEFAPRWRDLFGCEYLTIWTNAYQARRHEEALKCFDQIWVSRYGDNDPDVLWLMERFPKTGVWVGEHIPVAKRGTGAPCGRGTTDAMAVYSGGRLFPCCVGPGIPGAQSMEPCANWRQLVVDVPLPCGECCFSV